MKIPVLICALYLATGVAATGLRLGYEMVWLWYAYQLDLTKDPADRIIGVRCANWDNAAKVCTGGIYEPCAGTINEPGKVGSCSFREFQSHVFGNQAWRTQPMLPGGAGAQNNLNPDIVATAEYMDRHNPRYTRRLYNTWKAVKGGQYPPQTTSNMRHEYDCYCIYVASETRAKVKAW